ncbi:unnamed protein product [Rotaria sordida]|uniref:F-box domain-containing protein n=1 Tax=Rotaria sordida TaxID=392033 RepID=A0A814MZK1_9BILA|nr:unnamed protein product [Rotaria sordida]CAF1085169.1 unnamed protein product [Rotaria sordida]
MFRRESNQRNESSTCSLNKSQNCLFVMETISTFEVLPDEMILLICRYLRCGEILYSLFNLNSRLNSTITDFCHHVNLMRITYKQFDFVTTKVFPHIGLSIKSFVFNGGWENVLMNEEHSTSFQLKLSLMFPQLHTLVLMNFINNQLDVFLNKIRDLIELVKLDIRNFRGEHTEELLKKVLATNNNRLKSVSFDYDSIYFNLTSSDNDETVSYPNIEELTVNLTTDKTFEYLFALVPCINRLHINFDQLLSASKSTLSHICSLVHLKDFYLRSISERWSFDEIAYILSKMPSLRRLALDLCTDDTNLVNGQNFISILPSSVIEIHLFMIYYFESKHELDTLHSTWQTHIRIAFLLNEPNNYGVIHTIPCDLPSMVIPALIANSMMAGFEYTRKVTYLRICGKQSSTDIRMILQHFHRLRKLTLSSKNDLQSFTPQSTQPVVLHLPHLKSLYVPATCEIVHLLRAAPNLEHLRIDIDCLNIVLDDASTCELLQKRIVSLEVNHVREIDSIQLDKIAREFNHLLDLGVSLKDPPINIEVLILQILSLWKDKNLRCFYVGGSLTDEVSKNLRQWIVEYSHLEQDDLFDVEYASNSVVIWLS